MAEATTLTGTRRRLVEIDALVALDGSRIARPSSEGVPDRVSHRVSTPRFRTFQACLSVRHQRSLDRTGGLNKGEFLAHRNVHRSEDETANPTIEGTG